MRTKRNFLIPFIPIILFWWQANSYSSAEGLNFPKNKFYGRHRYKRSPESDTNEKNVDNNGRKCVENPEKTQIENIHTPINSINGNETTNNFFLDEELFDGWTENWGSQWPNIIDEHITNNSGNEIPNENRENEQQHSENVTQENFSELMPIENFEDIHAERPIDPVNYPDEIFENCFHDEAFNDKCTDDWHCPLDDTNLPIFSTVNTMFPMLYVVNEIDFAAVLD